MNIERLLDSRRQVRVFDDINIPDKSLIRNLLNTTHRLVPSKQNLLPYKVHVLGPECKKEKLILYNLSKLNDSKDIHNTCSLAPYVLIFTNRLAKTNPAVQKRIDKKGHDCFTHWTGGQHYWKEFPFVDETPFLTMSLGYRKHKQQPRHQGLVGEDKPEVNEVINWI